MPIFNRSAAMALSSPSRCREISTLPRYWSLRMNGVMNGIAVDRCRSCGSARLEPVLSLGTTPIANSLVSPSEVARPDPRYPLEIVSSVRARWPAAKPLSVRISAVDWAPGGMEPPDAVEVARMVVASGADIVDVSAGQTVPEAKPVYGRQFQTPFSDRIRHEARVPTMTVGNISSAADVNTILAAGRADLVVLARAHLWDPYWTRHAAAELGYQLPWPPPYATLNRYTPRLR